MKIQFTKKAKKIQKEKFDIHTGIYWKFILIFSAILLIASCAFGLYLFMSIDEDKNTVSGNTNLETETVNEDRIDKALQYFEKRAIKSKQIIESPAPLIDPSI